LCTTCPFKIIQSNSFPIVEHSTHQYRKADECEECQCEYNKHFPILYQLKYNVKGPENNRFDSKTKGIRDRLLQGGVIFADFLLHIARIEQDPFLPWFDLFIQEELYLYSQESASILNKELHRQLVKSKDEYQKQLYEIKHNQEQTSIDEIYRWIEKIQEFQMVNDQLNVIKKSQMKMMQYHEHDVSSQYADVDMSILLTGSEHS
jgi:hypothetical protein